MSVSIDPVDERGVSARIALRGPLADPFAADEHADKLVVTTERALQRLAIVSAQAARTFNGEPGCDPMAWMLAPRRLFSGATALTACLHQTGFVRAIAFLAAALSTDCEPSEIDEILELGEHDNGAIDRANDLATVDYSGGDQPALYTVTVAYAGQPVCHHSFHAVVARSEDQVRQRLGSRLAGMTSFADVARGFDASHPIAIELVSDAMSDLLMQVNRDPTGPLAHGLDLNFQQRFVG